MTRLLQSGKGSTSDCYRFLLPAWSAGKRNDVRFAMTGLCNDGMLLVQFENLDAVGWQLEGEVAAVELAHFFV